MEAMEDGSKKLYGIIMELKGWELNLLLPATGRERNYGVTDG
jgi:hypothetical protein